MRERKVLVVSSTPWNTNYSFGNTFSNLFDGMEGCRFSNIYCMDGVVNDPRVERAYQITEKQLILNWLGKSPAGAETEVRLIQETGETWGAPGRALVRFAKTRRWQILYWAREAVWRLGRWDNADLDRFIREFDPDLVLVVLYGNVHMCRVQQAVARRAGVPVVGYIWDDYYTLHQFSWSPLYWINRLYYRIPLKQTIDRCNLLYVISAPQKKEYDRIFRKDCHLLTKGGLFGEEHPPVKAPGQPLKLIYTGNIGNGRWKTLAQIGRVIQRINAASPEKPLVHMTICTPTPITNAIRKALDCPGSVWLAGRLPLPEVAQKQAEADLLVHVEPMDFTHRQEYRLSFSTKLIDYMLAYRPILAYGLPWQASIAHLKAHDGAFVASDEAGLEQTLREILARPALLEEYAAKGWACGAACHDIRRLHAMLRQDFEEVCDAGRSD